MRRLERAELMLRNSQSRSPPRGCPALRKNVPTEADLFKTARFRQLQNWRRSPKGAHTNGESRSAKLRYNNGVGRRIRIFWVYHARHGLLRTGIRAFECPTPGRLDSRADSHRQARRLSRL